MKEPGRDWADSAAWRWGVPLVTVMCLGLAGLWLGPPYVDRFGEVVRVPEGQGAWRPEPGVTGWRPYRMLSRRAHLAVRFSPYAEPDPDRSGGVEVPRVPHIDVPHPAWRRVASASAGGVRREGEGGAVWACPFPAPWLLDGSGHGTAAVPSDLEVWVDSRPCRRVEVAEPAQLEPGTWTSASATLYVATRGGRPGALRVLSRALAASPVPPPDAWDDPAVFPILRIWIGDEQRQALYLPPPGEAVDRLEVPAGAELRVSLGVLDPYPGSPGDGVLFRGEFVEQPSGRRHRLFLQAVDPAAPDGRRWHDLAVDLGALAGRRGSLVVSTQPRSVDRLYHAFLGDVTIVPRHPASRPPAHNLLVLLFDALRPDQLGAYGGPVATPHLDTLVHGDRCRYRALSTSSWTLPAVSSLFSGLYPSALGLPEQVPSDIGVLDVAPGTPTLFQTLHEQGWYTYAFLNNPFVKQASVLKGFDRVVFHLDAPADEVVQRAIEALDAVSNRWPFAAYLHFMDTHLPYREHTWSRRNGQTVVTSRPTAFTERSVVLSWKPTDAVKERAWALYRGEIAFLDHALGALQRWLSARDLVERTIVVAASDHGEAFWEHGSFEHGQAQMPEINNVVLYLCPEPAAGDEAQVRPAFRPGPGQARASLLDVRPTVLGMLGMVPEAPCQGVDVLSPRGEIEALDRALVAEGVLYGPPEHAVFGRRYGLVQEAGSRPALFDLVTDPWAYRDVAALHGDVVEALSSRYQAHLAEGGRIEDGLQGAEQPAGPGGRIDAETRAQLRALGYLP